MNGHRAIVVNIDNSYQFFEHAHVERAKEEAKRLAVTTPSGRYVVYVPVAIYEKTQPVQETLIDRSEFDGDLPF